MAGTLPAPDQYEGWPGAPVIPVICKELVTETKDVPGGEPFNVLFVCTANQCRSPMAEQLLRVALADLGYQWHVESAGISVAPGPAHPLAVQVLDEHSTKLPADWRSASRRRTGPGPGMVGQLT